MAEDARNRRQTAGQQVRIIDLPSDTGNHGLFDNLHGFESAARLADHLRSASSRFYGTPIRKFIEAIAPELDNIAVSIKGSVQQLVEDNCPGDDCDGQVKRGCARFGLIGVTGELVTSLDILPWSPGEALQAAGACFRAWVEARGGVEPSEEREGIAAVRAFLSAHGFSRFLPAWEQAAGADPKIINLAGYRKRSVDDQDGWDYFITTEAWAEIAAGFSKKSLAETLVKRGFLIPEDERHRSKSERIPEIGRRRVYHVSHKIFSGGGND
jgi:putative DNA primase/helicase